MQGLGLIEVLITLLVLSIGLLGLAGLQLNSLRNNQSAMHNSMAVIQTYNIVEAMQADTGVKDSNPRDFSGYNLPLQATVLVDDQEQVVGQDPAGNTYRDRVRRAWREEIRDLLGPSATSSINCVQSRCTIVIQWDNSRATLGANAHQITTQVQL